MAIEPKNEGTRELSLLQRFGSRTNLGKALGGLMQHKERLEAQQTGLGEELQQTNDIIEAVDMVFRLIDELVEELEGGATAVLETVQSFQGRVQTTKTQLNELLDRESTAPPSK